MLINNVMWRLELVGYKFLTSSVVLVIAFYYCTRDVAARGPHLLRHFRPSTVANRSSVAAELAIISGSRRRVGRGATNGVSFAAIRV